MERLQKIPIVCIMALTSLFFSFRKISHTDKNKGQAPYTLYLNAFSDFKAMQGVPLSDKYNDVLSVKLVYDIQAGTLYFVHSLAYRYHYDFCVHVLGYTDPINTFNTLNYGNSVRRQYYLANLNYYEHSHIYALEFATEDQINASGVMQMLQLIKSKTYLKDSLRLLICSDYFIKFDEEGKFPVPKVYPNDIYNGQKFQVLNTGKAYGILRQQEGLKNSVNFPDDIIIVKGTPVNVPICAGIITNAYQTPLSHINILCHNRNIPSAVQTDIWSSPQVRQYIDKPVMMEVTRDSITLTPVSQTMIDSFRHIYPAPNSVKLKYDLSVKQIIPIKDFGLKQRDVIGNKAAGVGELNKISHKLMAGFVVPESGFAIPFYFYSRHVSCPAITPKIDTLIQMQHAGADERDIGRQLKLIRTAIKEQTLDPGLLKQVSAMIKQQGNYRSFRFRSSANAEDVLNFSAAGLYDSRTGKQDDTDKPVDMAIKKVWASVYNDNAYLERANAGIDEHTMMMGILVHRNFPDEIANGVAITKNLYREKFPGYTVNVQTGEVPVVSPPDSVTCEQFVCMKANVIDLSNYDMSVDYITYSNITNGKPVLTQKQVRLLYNALETVNAHYRYNIPAREADKYMNGLDVEFKFEKNGKLYLKQVRPYR